LTIATGPESDLALTMDGAENQLLRASGVLNIDVFGFVATQGNMTLTKKTDSVVLNDAEFDDAGELIKPASVVEVDSLAIGGSDLRAFAGMGGGYDNQGNLNAGAIGLSLTGTNFGLALLTERPVEAAPEGYEPRSWTSLQATVESAAFVGVSGLTVAVDTLDVQINRPATADQTLVDYKAQGLAIDTGTRLAPSTLTLGMDGSEGPLLRATGNLEIDAFGFVQVSGGFGIEKKQGTVGIADNKLTPTEDESGEVDVDMLLIGGSNLSAFAGVNGGLANATGLSLSGVNLGLALLSERFTTAEREAAAAQNRTLTARSWTSLQAEVGSAAFVGVEGLTARVDTLTLGINRAAFDGSVVDYALTADTSDAEDQRYTDLAVLTGPGSSLALTLDGSRGVLTEARGRLSLDIFGFVQVEGEFAIEKADAPVTLTLDGGDTVQAQALRMGGSNLNAFAGIDGGKASAMGLELRGATFGLALLSHTSDETRSWTSLQATAGSAAFVGVEGLTIAADTLSIEINRAGKIDDKVVDYGLTDPEDLQSERRTALKVATGLTSEVTLSMEGAQGDLLRASGNLRLDVFGFFQASGAFAIERRTESFWLNDGVVVEEGDTTTTPRAPTRIDARLLTIGGTGIDAFAGINGGTSDAMGLSLTGVDFGLALISELPETQGATPREFTTLKANAAGVSLVGIEGLEAQASRLQVEINRGIPGLNGQPDTVIDYSAQQLEVLAGPDKTVTLDVSGTLGEMTRAAGDLTLDLFGFAQVEGSFAFQQSTAEVTLARANPNATAERVIVDALTVGGLDVDAFVGVNGQDADNRIGLALQDFDFGLALMSSRADPTRKWTSLEATAGSLEFVGIDGLTMAGDTLSLAINQAEKAGDRVVDSRAMKLASAPLQVATGPDSEMDLNLDGREGESLRASGNLTVDLFGFVAVQGGFAITQTYRDVTLSDGSTIEAAQVLTIGGNEIDAFAGINGGYDEQGNLVEGALGVSLGDASFGLALIADTKDASRSFTSLKATAALAEFVGVDGLTVRATDLEVLLNKGITEPFQPEVTEKVNTKLTLTVPVELVGTLTLSRAAGTGDQTHAADSAQVTVLTTDTNESLTDKIREALESLDGVGAGQVVVSGDRYEGYTIEFIGELEGQLIDDITVSAQQADASAVVSTVVEANAGVNEVKQIVVQALRGEPDPVTVTVGTTTQGYAGKTEISTVTFTRPSQAGTYDVFFMDSGVVREERAPVAGVDEVQRLVVFGDTTASAVTPTSNVSTVQEGGGTPKNERYTVTFTNRFGDQGFRLYFVNDGVLPVRYHHNYAEDPATTITQLKSAYSTLLDGYQGITVRPSDIQVVRDTSYKGSGNRYLIEFVGSLTGVNVEGIGMRSEKDTFSNVNTQQGKTGQSEIQKVEIDSNGTSGNFTLSLTHGGTTYTTTGMKLGSNAATVRYALNAALASSGGQVEVTSSAAGSYVITFGGSLSGQNLAPLVVNASSTASAPSGSFTLTLAGQTTRSISYNTDGAALARQVQSELARLSGVGSGNVQVTYNAQASSSTQIGLDIRFKGSLAQTNVGGLTLVSTLANASAEVRTLTQGVSAVDQVQWVALGDDAIASGARLALTWAGKTYQSAVISGGDDATAIEAALRQGLGSIAGLVVEVEVTDPNTFTVSFGGSLSGQRLNLMKLSVEGQDDTPAGSGSYVPGNASQNVTNLQRAFFDLLKSKPEYAASIQLSDIRVERLSSTGAGDSYRVSYVGSLDRTNIADGMIAFDTPLQYVLVQDGEAGVSEVQTVRVERAADTDGRFTLSLTQGGRTFTTSAIELGATAGHVKAALEAAVSGAGGSATVLSSLGTVTVTQVAEAGISGAAADLYELRFGGGLANVDVASVRVGAVSVDPALPTGSFTIAYTDGAGTERISTPIVYSSDAQTLKANLQAALEAESMFGAGNVLVAVDTGETAGRQLAYTLSFSGDLATTDVPNVISDFSELSLGIASPYNLAQGETKTGEVQRVVVTSIAPEVDFKLTLNHLGQSVETGLLSTTLSKAEAQAVIDEALATLQGQLVAAGEAGFDAQAELSFWSGKTFELDFGGSLIGADVSPVVVTIVPRSVAVGLDIEQAGETTVTPAQPIRTVVVDYALTADETDEADARSTDLVVETGPDSTITLDLEGSLGELMRITGTLEIDAFGFFQVEGDFAIDRYTDEIVVAAEDDPATTDVDESSTVVAVDRLTIGASNAKAFAGINGGSDDRIGLLLGGSPADLSAAGNVDFGLAILTEKRTGFEPAGYELRSWTSLYATAGSVDFVGVEGLTVHADTLSVEINRPARDASLVDYAARPLAVMTSGGEEPSSLTLSMAAADGPLLRATGNLEIDAFGFVQVSGGFGIEKKQGTVTLADRSATTDLDESDRPVNVDMLLIGGSELRGFAGVNGGRSNAIGVLIEDVDFGLALLSERFTTAERQAAAAQNQTLTARSWTSLQAEVGRAAFIGVDGLTLEVSTLQIGVNLEAADRTVVDYRSGATDLSILTGPARSLTLSLDGSRGEFYEAAGSLNIDLFGFVQLSGDFAISKQNEPIEVKLADGSEVQAQALLIGASNVRAFAGINGGTDDAIGLELTGVQFGLALLSDANDSARTWTSLQASGRSAGLIGVDGLTLAAEEIVVEINQAGRAADPVIDYALTAATDDAADARNTDLEVATGIAGAIALSMDGRQGRLLRAAARANINAFGFFQASGGFAIESRDEIFYLNDGNLSDDPALARAPTEIKTRVLTIGASEVNAFAGVNGGTADAVGLSLEDVDFGLLLASEIKDDGSAGRSFTTLVAEAGSVDFIGIDGFEVGAEDLRVEINRGIAGVGTDPDVVIDHSFRQFEVLAGPDGASVTLSSDGGLGELTRASGKLSLDVFGFVTLEGNLALELSRTQVKLAADDDGVVETVDADLLAVGGSGLDAFVGVNGRDLDNRIGLSLDEAEFGLALLTDRANAERRWLSLQAGAEQLSFEGIAGLTAQARTISVAINQSIGAIESPVVDYADGATALAVRTNSAGDAIDLSMRGVEGEVIKASAELTLDLFGFVNVQGEFAIEQRTQPVTLIEVADADSNFEPVRTTVEKARLVTIGGRNVSAFAGINGALDADGNLNPEAVGLSLGGLDFGLALITDPNHPDRNFTSLQATATSLEFTGLSVLTAQVEDIVVNLNQGVTLDAVSRLETRVNTQVALNIPSDLVGTVTLSKGAADQAVQITAAMGNSDIVAALVAGFEALPGIGEGNVAITGNRSEGFTVEFVGDLEGKTPDEIGVDELGVAVERAAVTIGVSEETAANPGVSEIKQIIVQALPSAPPPASVKVSTTTQGQPGLTETNEVIFTSPNQAGDYEVFFATAGLITEQTGPVLGVDAVQRLILTGDTSAQASSATASVQTVTQGDAGLPAQIAIVFKADRVIQEYQVFRVDAPATKIKGVYRGVTNTAQTIAELKTAYATLLKSLTGNQVRADAITVTEDTAFASKNRGQQRFVIGFTGALADQSIPAMGFQFFLGSGKTSNTGYSYTRLAEGGPAKNEVQRISLSTQGAGSFSLQLVDGARTYTTTGIEFGANAATVSFALNAALGTGSVSVTKEGSDYLVSFDGAFGGRDLSLLTVNTSPTRAVPGGSFTLAFGGQTTAPIAYTTDGAVLAKRVQTALTGLGSIGANGVSVSFNASASGSTRLGLDIRFSGALSERPVTLLTVGASGLVNASASVRELTTGVVGVAQVQDVELFDDALDNGYRLSLAYLGKTYQTGLIAGSATSSEVQTALRTALSSIAGLTVTVGPRVADTYTISLGGELEGTRFNTLALTVEGAEKPAETGRGSFVVGDIAQNIANLKSAYADLTKDLTGGVARPDFIAVTHDPAYVGGERYIVRFVGDLDWTDIASKGIVFQTPLDYSLVQNGAPAKLEQQLVTLDRGSADATGTFRLALSHGGRSYTTADISFDASAADLQSALNAALGGSGRTATVSAGAAADQWQLQYSGAAFRGVDVSTLGVSAVDVTPDSPSGSFTISYVDSDGLTLESAPIDWSASSATLRANIQSAMDGLFGANTVDVAIDTQDSRDARQAFELQFKGALARQDIPQVTSHFGELNLAVVQPYNVVQGESVTGEVQRVSIETTRPDAAYTLSFTHAGQSATTAQLSTRMSAPEIQAAIDTAMGELSALVGGGFNATATLDFYGGKELELRFGGSLSGVDVQSVTAAVVATASPSGLELVQSGYTEVREALPLRTMVVDYGWKDADDESQGRWTELEVRNGTAADAVYELTLDGTRGEVLEAVGTLTIDVSGFVQLSGRFGFGVQTQGSDELLVAAGSDITARLAASDSVYVQLSGAAFGLYSDSNGQFAFELSQGEFDASIAGLANVSADEVIVQYTNADTEVAQGRAVEIADLGYTFTRAIAKNTIAFGVTGFSANVADFVSLSGDMAFRKVGSDIVAVGNNMSASLTAGPVYVRLSDADFGLMAGNGKVAFELSNGSFGAGIEGLADFSATEVIVQYTNATTSIAADTELDVLGLTYTFEQAVLPSTVAFGVKGFSANVADFVRLSGDLAFKKQGSQIIAVGNNVNASLEAGPVYVRLADADFGLLAGNGQMAFELSNGSFAAGIEGLAGVSAQEVIVQYTNASTSIAQNTTIGVLDIGYTFEQALLPSTIAFGVKGFSANVANFVRLSGDLGFKKQGSEIIAVGNNVNAALEAGPVYARLNNASFGLIAGDGKFGFELSRGSFDLGIEPLFNIGAREVIVQYTNSSTTIAAGRSVGVLDINYTFAQAIQANTIAFGVKGFSADIAGFVSLSGDLAFKKSGNQIIAVGNNVSAALEAGVYIRLNNAYFGLMAGEGKLAFELSRGSFEMGIATFEAVRANEVIVQYTNASTSITAGQTIGVLDIEYTFQEAIAANTIAFGVKGFRAGISGFVELSGDLGFKMVGDDIVAAGNNITATLEVGPAYVRLLHADFGLIVGNGKFAFEMSNGTFELGIENFASVSVQEVIIRYTNDQTTIAQGTTISAAQVNYTFDEAISANTIAFYALGFRASLMDVFTVSGNIGFEKTEKQVRVASGLTRSTVTAETITITGGNIDVFVGVPDPDPSKRIGFIAEDIGFAFAYVREKQGGRTWYSLQAEAGEIGFVGLPETSFKIENIQDVKIAANLAASDGSVVDYARTRTDLGVNVGSTSTYVLDIEGGKGEFIGAELNIGIRVADFFRVSGTFAFEAILSRTVVLSHVSPLNVRPDGMLQLPDGNEVSASGVTSLLQQVEVQGFSFGAGDLNAFVGIPGGPGIELEDVNFTFVFLREKDALVQQLTRHWVSLQATAGRVEFVGLPSGFELRAERIDVDVNMDAYILVDTPYGPVPSPIDATTVDYAASRVQGSTFGTASTILMDMPGSIGPRIQATGYVSLKAFDFLHAETNIIYEQTSEKVRLNTGEEVEVNVLAVGATDTTFFIGTNPGTPDAMGFGITDASFVVLDMLEAEPAPGQDPRRWKSIKAEVGAAGLIGVDAVEISGTNLIAALNLDAMDGTLVDFSRQTGLPMPISDYGFEYVLDRTDLPYAKLGGTFTFRAFDLIDETITLDVVQTFVTVALSDGSTTPVAMLSFAKSNLNFMAGSGDIGFRIDNADFGIAVAIDLLNPSRVWVTSVATSDRIAFEGLEELLAFDIRNASFIVNTAASDGVSINYQRRPLQLKEGLGVSLPGLNVSSGSGMSDITLDMAGEQIGIKADLTLTLLGAMTLSGSFSFNSSEKQYRLTNGDLVTVDALEFAAIGVDGFLGYRGSDTQVGFLLEDLDLGLGIYKDVAQQNREWLQLSTKVGRIAFVGLPGVKAEARNIDLSFLRLSSDRAVIDLDRTPIDFGRPGAGLTRTLADFNLDNLAPGTRPDFGSVFNFGGEFELNLFDLVKVQDDFDFRLELQTVQLSDGSTTEVFYVSFALPEMDIFAGVGSRNDGVGVAIDNLTIAAAIFISPTSGGAWVAVQGHSDFAGIVGIPGFQLQTQSIDLEISSADALDRTIDFSATPVSVPFGLGLDLGNVEIKLPIADGEFTFDMPGTPGTKAQVLLNDVLLSIGSVLYVSGDVGVTLASMGSKAVSTGGILPRSGKEKPTSYVAFAATDVNVFLGINGPYFGPEPPPSNVMGIYARNVDLGVVAWNSGDIGVKVNVEQAGIVGLGDFLRVDLQDVFFEMNKAPESNGMPVSPIDYKATFGDQGLEIRTGGDSVFMDFETAAEIRARVTWAEVSILDFIHLEGSLVFSMGEKIMFAPADSGVLKELTGGYLDTLYHDLELMVIGGLNMRGFIGIGGPDSPSRVGFAVEDFDFGMIMATPTGIAGFELPQSIQQYLPKYMALKAKIGYAGLVGMGDVMKLSVQDVTVKVNTSSIKGLPQSGGLPFINWKANRLGIDGLDSVLETLESFGIGGDSLGFLNTLIGPVYGPRGYRIDTGLDEEFYIDFTEPVTVSVDIGLAEIMISQFLHLRGSLNFTKGAILPTDVNLGGFKYLMQDLTGSDSVRINMDTMTIGGANLTGFVGINGPYRYGDDLNADGLPDKINEGAVGMVIDNVDFGVAIMMPQVLSFLPFDLPIKPWFIAVKAKVGYAGLVGIDRAVLDVRAEDVEVNINQFYLDGAGPEVNLAIQLFGAPTIDWRSSFPRSPEDRDEDGVFDTYDEDINNNGRLDPGEDRNENGQLDVTEDLDRNGVQASYGYALPAGGNNAVIIDFEEMIVQAKIGYAAINVAGVLQLYASMAFTLKAGDAVTLQNGEKTEVMSLAFGINDAFGFIGVGGYWRDGNNDGRIDERDIPFVNTSAVGIALQDLDLGFIIARELIISTTRISIGVYLAAKIRLDKLGLVGIPGVVLEAENLQIDLNLGFRMSLQFGQLIKDEATGAVSYQAGFKPSFGPMTVDWSKSKWTDPGPDLKPGTEDDTDYNAYAIETGNPREPILLDYKETYIRVYGQARLNLFDMVDMRGVLDFRISESEGLQVFADVQMRIGPAGQGISSRTTALLIINSGGLALRAVISQGISIGSVVKLSVELEVAINTFGRDIVYQVPEDFVKDTGFTEFRITAYPPGRPDLGGNGVVYVSLSGAGMLSLFDGALALQGQFQILAVKRNSEFRMELGITAQLKLPLLEPLGATGTLGFVFDGASTGLYGSIDIGGNNPSSTLIQSPVFEIRGRFMLQINTTDKVQKVRGRDAQGRVFDDNNQPILVDATPRSMKISGMAEVVLKLGMEIKMRGSIDVLVDSEGLQLDMRVSLDLAMLGSVNVEAQAAILNRNGTPIFAMRAVLDLTLGVDLIGIRAKGTLLINTGDTDYYTIGTPARIIPANIFEIEIDGRMNILAFELALKGGIKVQNGVFELRIDRARLPFFNFMFIEVNGYIRSNGEFFIKGTVSYELNFGIARMYASMSIWFGNESIGASFKAGLDITLNFGLFKLNFTLAGIEGLIELTAAHARLEGAVTVVGIRVGFGIVWSWAGPPDIAHQVGDTVYLHSGERPGRYGPAVYDKVISSDYTITSLGGNSIVVSSLGQHETFHGVNRIVAVGGPQKDTILVQPGVNARLEFEGRGGSDNYIIFGGAPGSVIKGEEGNDSFTSGPAAGINFLGGDGDDKFVGGSGGGIIDLGTGVNTISLSGGSSRIRVADSPDTRIKIGSGSALIETDLNGALDVRGSGAATIVLDDIDSVTGPLTMAQGAMVFGGRFVSFDSSAVEKFVVHNTNANRNAPLRVLMDPSVHWG
ncbi:MAG: hypothetical protein RL322_2626, partial [Pseudomonadota bacterium]